MITTRPTPPTRQPLRAARAALTLVLAGGLCLTAASAEPPDGAAAPAARAAGPASGAAGAPDAAVADAAGSAGEAAAGGEAKPAAPAKPRKRRRKKKPDLPAGLWKRARVRSSDPGLGPEERERVRQLETLGYVAGSLPPSATRTVTVHVREAVEAGANFLTSGHAPEALLVDMDGRVLHRWRSPVADTAPEPDPLRPPLQYWRRAHLLPNGDVLAIANGLQRLDRDSNVLWSAAKTAHHDLHVTPEGDVYVLTRQVNRVEGINSDKPFLEDFVTVVGADGREKRSVSVFEALVRSPFSDLFDPAQTVFGDLLHTNSIELLDGSIADRAPEFAAGRVLISMAVPSLIAVMDLDAGRIVWAYKADFKRQHDPKILPSGNLLLFDNVGRKRASRILELDPATLERRWVYAGSEQEPFFSQTCGTAQRLPGGNTLITESDNGRAFEVLPDGTIVWEYHNPYRAGPKGEFVAALFEVVRLPVDFPLDWTEAAAKAAGTPARSGE